MKQLNQTAVINALNLYWFDHSQTFGNINNVNIYTMLYYRDFHKPGELVSLSSSLVLLNPAALADLLNPNNDVEEALPPGILRSLPTEYKA